MEAHHLNYKNIIEDASEESFKKYTVDPCESKDGHYLTFWDKMEIRIKNFFRNERIEISSLEILEHQKLMQCRKKLNKIQTGIKSKFFSN